MTSVAPVQRAKLPHGQFPEMMQLDVRAVNMPGEPAQRAARLGTGIDGEVRELLGHEAIDVVRRGSTAARTEATGKLEFGIGRRRHFRYTPSSGFASSNAFAGRSWFCRDRLIVIHRELGKAR